MLGSIPIPGDLPFRFDFSLDWRVFGYVAAIALAAGVAVGLVPAVRAARTNLSEALHEGGRAVGAAGRHRVRNLLVASQMAGTMVLLVAAGLFVRSLENAQRADLGFDPRNVMNFTMDPAQQGYDEARGRAFYRELEQRVRALPGVESASLANNVRMSYNNMSEYVNYEGQQLAAGERRPIAGYNTVGLDYFRTMRIPIVRGRDFTSEDTPATRPVAIINEFMAQKFWPGQDPIGRRFSMSGLQGPYLEVVGVTKNGKYQWIFEDPAMHFFLPFEQSYKSLRVLQVRTVGPSPTLGATILRTIRGLDAELPVYDVMTMEQSLGGPNGFWLIRMGAMFAAVLGLLGLSLAVVGVYGVVSYATAQRTHEIGLRMALGAHPGSILRMILAQGMRLVLVGVGAGLLLAAGVGRLMSNLLFGVSPADPLTFGSVALLLGAVALLACVMPARRAARVDPMVALRYE
jgi:predicted permease